jgi:high-affinity iron transporter
MLSSFVLSLREGLEAALIIGIVLGALRKLDRRDLSPLVWVGVISAIIISIVVAVALNLLGTEFEGTGEEVFEGITMLLAAGILTWMIFWMRTYSISMREELEIGVRQATSKRRQWALFLLAFLAVLREGIELALFLLAVRLTSSPVQTVLGASLGIGGAILLGWILFATTRRVSLTHFFQYTNALLIVFAAGMVGIGIHEFNEAGWVPAIIEHIWDASFIIPEESTLGQLLRALVGYSSSPSLSQVIAYVGYWVILGLSLWSNRQPHQLTLSHK